MVKGVTLDELYRVDEGGDVAKGITEANDDTDDNIMPVCQREDEPGRVKRWEISEAPLCANCLVDIEAENLDENRLARQALSRIARRDDGLARHRWEQRMQHTVVGNSINERKEESEVSLLHLSPSQL